MRRDVFIKAMKEEPTGIYDVYNGMLYYPDIRSSAKNRTRFHGVWACSLSKNEAETLCKKVPAEEIFANAESGYSEAIGKDIIKLGEYADAIELWEAFYPHNNRMYQYQKKHLPDNLRKISDEDMRDILLSKLDRCMSVTEAEFDDNGALHATLCIGKSGKQHSHCEEVVADTCKTLGKEYQVQKSGGTIKEENVELTFTFS